MYVAILYSFSDLKIEIRRFNTPCSILYDAIKWVQSNATTFDYTEIKNGDYCLKLVRHDANGDLPTDFKDSPATFQITVIDGKGSIT